MSRKHTIYTSGITRDFKSCVMKDSSILLCRQVLGPERRRGRVALSCTSEQWIKQYISSSAIWRCDTKDGATERLVPASFTLCRSKWCKSKGRKKRAGDPRGCELWILVQRFPSKSEFNSKFSLKKNKIKYLKKSLWFLDKTLKVRNNKSDLGNVQLFFSLFHNARECF